MIRSLYRVQVSFEWGSFACSLNQVGFLALYFNRSSEYLFKGSRVYISLCEETLAKLKHPQTIFSSQRTFSKMRTPYRKHSSVPKKPHNSYPGTMPMTLWAPFRVSCPKTSPTLQQDNRPMDSGNTFLTATLYSMTCGYTVQNPLV